MSHRCYKHLFTRTSLRCRDCNRGICVQCAIKQEIGYICRRCDKQRQRKFEQRAAWYRRLSFGQLFLRALITVPLATFTGITAYISILESLALQNRPQASTVFWLVGAISFFSSSGLLASWRYIGFVALLLMALISAKVITITL